jgi:hypothetical protein
MSVDVKVNDGIVLASDSATTLGAPLPGGGLAVSQVYNNATKIFKLHKELPLGAVTWGLGSIGRSSLKLLAKDFRSELVSGNGFDPKSYTIEQVALLWKDFMFDKRYNPTFDQIPDEHKPAIGFMVAGYSTNAPRGEVWRLLTEKGACYGPNATLDQDTCGFRWEGEPLPLRRLVLGFDPVGLDAVLTASGLDANKVSEIIENCRRAFGIRFANDSMPIQDAIDLAVFLEQTSAGFSRFCDGPASVGGPVEVAVLTKYEGFKWVKRKHV